MSIEAAPIEVVVGRMTPVQAKEQAAWLRDTMRAALVEGADYGVIPGTGSKPTLFKAGAEMLLIAAGLGFDQAKVDDEDARTHQGVTYRCTVYHGDTVRAVCEGYAGYDEIGFYSSAEASEQRERANARRYQRAPNPAKFVEYRASWNTILKMAQKRALVGAALNAVAGSGLFIADLDDAGADSPAKDTKLAPTDVVGVLQPATAAAPAALSPRSLDQIGADVDALPQAQREAFARFIDSRNLPWPTSSRAVLLTIENEVRRLSAEALPPADPDTGEIVDGV